VNRPPGRWCDRGGGRSAGIDLGHQLANWRRQGGPERVGQRQPNLAGWRGVAGGEMELHRLDLQLEVGEAVREPRQNLLPQRNEKWPAYGCASNGKPIAAAPKWLIDTIKEIGPQEGGIRPAQNRRRTAAASRRSSTQAPLPLARCGHTVGRGSARAWTQSGAQYSHPQPRTAACPLRRGRLR